MGGTVEGLTYIQYLLSNNTIIRGRPEAYSSLLTFEITISTSMGFSNYHTLFYFYSDLKYTLFLLTVTEQSLKVSIYLALWCT
jgi:hypothetical protein